MSGDPSKIRVLIVDDTITYRVILKGVLSQFDEVEVIGQASNGSVAIRKTKELKPDLILLDIEMPEMDGFETLKKIREFDNEVEVIIVSSVNQTSASKTLETLEHGALDFIPKPQESSQEESEKALQESLGPVLKVTQIRLNSRIAARSPHRAPLKKSKAPPKKKSKIDPLIAPLARPAPLRSDLLLIGISTGGPNALQSLVPDISKEIGCPILIVQHMPPTFTKQLGERLNQLTDLSVREAKDDEMVSAGDVLIAPGGSHMIVEKRQDALYVRTTDTPPVHSCKPSVDVLFESALNLDDMKIVTLIMTGMGADGADSVHTLREKGAYSLIQSEDSCTIWGMPAAVKENEDYDEEIPLAELATRINELTVRY